MVSPSLRYPSLLEVIILPYRYPQGVEDDPLVPMGQKDKLIVVFVVQWSTQRS